MSYTYDATGRKLRSTNGISGQTRDYVDGIEYVGGSLEMIAHEEGRITKSGSTYTYQYFLRDHLGNNRVGFAQGGNVTVPNFSTDYYPFGLANRQYIRVGSPKNNYLYNGKELQDGLRLYDYGARLYDPVTGRWNAVDPLAEKYYALTPYNYVANNPLLFVDPDGRDIIAFNAIRRDADGNYVYERDRVSAKTARAVKAIMSTAEGMAFFAQFARKGQKVFGHTFSQDGKYVDHDLVIQDFSLQKETGDLNKTFHAEGAFRNIIKKGKATFYLQLFSSSQNESSLVETATHETQLHGYKISDIIDALNEGGIEAAKKLLSIDPTGEKDHEAKNNKDINHKGYQLYKSVMEQLSERDERYKSAFDEENR